MATNPTYNQLSEAERGNIAALTTEANLHLKAAERAWHAVFAALPVGAERNEAYEVFERIRCAKRRPF